MLLTACNQTESSNPTSSAASTAATSAATNAATSATTSASTSASTEWWAKDGTPTYGGVYNIRGGNLDTISFDPGVAMASMNNKLSDALFMWDPGVDFATGVFDPQIVDPQYYVGALAESWEQTDPLTYTVHLRKGIKWHNVAPANGREFTAQDVQYNWDRLLGTGNGYTTPNPFYAATYASLDRVVAIDTYTVEFRMKKLGYNNPIFVQPGAGYASPEWIQEYAETEEGALDWQHAAGTAAFMLSDVQRSVSITYKANPDYYLNDPRFPENKLPYLDEVKYIWIADKTTALSALRTGKIDYMFDMRDKPTWKQIQTMQQTDPTLKVYWLITDGYTLNMRVDNGPFSDINVRKALQLAIDRQAIAQAFYPPIFDGSPMGLVGPNNTGWAIPYAEWPEALQEEYSYDPAKAKQLLADAGYPDGFDTNCLASSGDDQEVLLALQGYLQEINVNMEIKVSDMSSFMDLCFAGKNDQMAYFTSCGGTAPRSIQLYATERRNFVHNNDETFNQMWEDLVNAPDLETAQKLCQEADMYALEHHWSINLFSSAAPFLVKSYIKGYCGQNTPPALVWLDQAEKTAAGY